MLGYWEAISSGVSPRFSYSTTISMTRMRCPAMHALPPQTPGVLVMCWRITSVIGHLILSLTSAVVLAASQAQGLSADRDCQKGVSETRETMKRGNLSACPSTPILPAPALLAARIRLMVAEVQRAHRQQLRRLPQHAREPPIHQAAPPCLLP